MSTNTQSAFQSLEDILLDGEREKEKSLVTSMQVTETKDAEVIVFEEGVERDEPTKEQIDDFVFVRKTFHSMIEQAQELLAPAIKEAKTSAHPRQIDAANQTMKNISDMASSLLDVHERMKRITRTDTPTTQAVPYQNQSKTTNVVIMSTLDMMDAKDSIKSIIEGDN